MQKPSNNAVTTVFGYVPGYPLNGGYHMGVDFGSSPDLTIYAPEDGNYQLVPNNGTLGNAVHMYTGNRHHAFGHTSKYLITNNQFVKQGQPIAIMGATGAAQGVHLHWALAINNSLVNPLSQVTNVTQGGKIMDTDAKVAAQYFTLRGSVGTAAERKAWIGKSYEEFNKVAKAEATSRAKQVTDLRTALTNAQNQPPKVVVKEVIKIVEKPVGGALTPEESAAIKETNGIVKAIQALLGKVFK